MDAITRTIQGWEGVRAVWSLTTVEELVGGESGAEPRPLVLPPLDTPGVEARTRAALDRNPDVTGWLVSGDRRTGAFLIQIADRPDDPVYRTRLIDDLRRLMAAHAGNGVTLYLTGMPVQKHDVSFYVDRDQRVLLPLAVVVLGVTLAGFFRHVAGVLVPLGVAGLTVVWTMGVYAWSGHALNAITSLLAAVRTIAVPATLCAVTTAQGYFSLLTGLTMITGVVCDLLVLPASLVLVERAGLRMR